MSHHQVEKICWKAGNMVYPLPAVLVSCGDEKKSNIITVGWTGTVCTNPAMTYISLRPSRYSYHMIKERGYFAINLTTEALAYATDFCGVKSGRDYDKFKEMELTPFYDENTKTPMIEESPVSVLCKVTEIKPLGSHDLFLAQVVKVYVSKSYMNKEGKFDLNQTGLMVYSHGTYLSVGKPIGSFGYSISKKPESKRLAERSKAAYRRFKEGKSSKEKVQDYKKKKRQSKKRLLQK